MSSPHAARIPPSNCVQRFGIGGEYGEGALQIHGKTPGYYSIAAASIGFQLGVQKKDVILAQALRGCGEHNEAARHKPSIV